MVKVKIKTNKKRVYEAAPSLSRHTVQMGAKIKSPEERRMELSNLWGKLMKQKDVDIRKLYSKTMVNSGYQIPLAKMNVPVKVKVTDAITGATREEEIIPAQIAAFCDLAKANAMTQKHLGTILQRFPKPVIWTFMIDTAASDGVRIAFNPIFAQELIYQGKQQVKDALAAGERMGGDERTIRVARLFLFVLVHEAYHQIYRHREQAERKTETQGGSNHRLANIAMDAEINRDIEKQIPQWFAGATAESNGIFDQRFRMEPWQDIFDAYFYKKMEPPQQTNQNPINQNNSSQPQSSNDSQSGDSQQQQGNSQQQGKNNDGQGGDSGMSQDNNTDNQQQGSNSDNSQNSKSQNAGSNDSGQSGNGYDDTDLSKADSDAMADYDDLEIPDISDKSKEYQDAYEDELRKELDKALDKTSQGTDNSDENGDSDNQDDNGMSTPGSGKPDMQTDQEMDGMSTSGSGKPDGEDSDGNEQGNSTMSSGSSNGQDGDDSSNSSGNMNGNRHDGNTPMSPEERSAREQARKDIQKAIQDLKDKIESEMSNVSDDEEMQKQLEGKTFETETSSIFGGCDMLSREEMAELAADAGKPYTSQELTADVDELNKQFNEKNESALKAISPELSKKLSNIAEQLKALVALANWKQKLKKHFRDAMEGAVEQVRSKRAMSQKWRDDRYNPYKDREYKEENGANVFYLLDGSGSMYVNGTGVFMQIFKDIITIEKTCGVDMSARAYFAGTAITPKNVTMWNRKTNKNKVLDILADIDANGSTDIPDNVMAVTKLKPPYYFNNGEKHTLVMVFTDGETNTGSGWEELKRIPFKIRKDVVFVILNTKAKIMKILPQIMAQGVPLKNILGINTLTYNN